MDVAAMAMSKPKVIDLTKYCTADGETFQDVISMLLLGSLENNGGIRSALVQDKDFALRKALTTDRQIVLSMQFGDAVTKAPATVTMVGDTAAQCSATSFMYMDGVIALVLAAIVFSDGDNDVHVYVNTIPIGD